MRIQTCVYIVAAGDDILYDIDVLSAEDVNSELEIEPKRSARERTAAY